MEKLYTKQDYINAFNQANAGGKIVALEPIILIFRRNNTNYLTDNPVCMTFTVTFLEFRLHMAE